MDKKLKLSQFNIEKMNDNKLLLFNTLSQGLLELDEENIEEYEKLKQGISENQDLMNILSQGSMLVPQNVEEIENIKLINNIIKFDKSSLNLTIAPTLECNFACTYCYEKGKRYNTMNEETIEAIVKYVEEKATDIQNLSICWYGGEPLIQLPIIETLTEKFKKICGADIKYNAIMVTNGYLLDVEKARKLKELSVDTLQITLDGTKEIHDKRRFLVDKSGTFDEIINNVKECCEVINISIRINLDKSNSNQSIQLLDLLEDPKLKNKVSFYVAQVDDINNTCSNTSCLNDSEFSQVEIEFYKKAWERGLYRFSFPSFNACFCGAITFNNYVIDPLGDLYKCWNTIGYKEMNLGNVFDGIKMNENLTRWINYNQYNSKCSGCNVFPICNGGCPYHSLTAGENKCRSFKYNHTDIIDLFYQQKKNDKK